jgi:hypothetical protein
MGNAYERSIARRKTSPFGASASRESLEEAFLGSGYNRAIRRVEEIRGFIRENASNAQVIIKLFFQPFLNLLFLMIMFTMLLF